MKINFIEGVEITPPLDCSHEKLVAYIQSMKGGERVMEMGESGLKGCTGRVIIKDAVTCIQWDRKPGDMGIMTTGFTGGARVIPGMSEEEWLSRCAARLVDQKKISDELAKNISIRILLVLEDDITVNPEDAADEELQNWTTE